MRISRLRNRLLTLVGPTGSVTIVPPDPEPVVDVTAPTLSSPTGTQTGQTTATIGVTTNEANGTLYSFVSTSATPPSGADLKAGTGAVFANSQTITTTGAKTASATGLTAATAYYVHWLHRDAAGNDSTIATSASFTTAAAVTNLFGSPDALDASPWSAYGTGHTVVADQAASPVTGLTTADKIYPTASGSFRGRRQTISVTTGLIYEWTVSAKTAGQQWLLMYGDNVAVGSKGAWFDLVNGVMGSINAGLTADITSLGSGWYRCRWRYTATGTNAAVPFIYSNTDGNTVFTCTTVGTDGLLIADSKLITI